MQLPLSNMPRGWEVTIQKMWPVPEPAFTVLCTPDDGYGWHLKHVESTCRLINRLLCVASHWTIINIYHCVQCAVFEAELRSRLVYLSVIVSGHFLKRCIHATATMILCHINSHKIFSVSASTIHCEHAVYVFSSCHSWEYNIIIVYDILEYDIIIVYDILNDSTVYPTLITNRKCNIHFQTNGGVEGYNWCRYAIWKYPSISYTDAIFSNMTWSVFKNTCK